jgi:D-beta-D-heptose 7-phosphate kinase / D-beta-D-heptose 1-phosphate adenosyltransferase
MRSTKTVVFTNGVFDLYHAGHVALLNAARTYGDVLIVGIPDDRTVQRRKGPGRPVWPVARRELMVASHPGVTMTIVYSGSPVSVLRAIRPDILVRGEDQRSEGAEYACRLVRLQRTPGISTTQIIKDYL